MLAIEIYGNCPHIGGLPIFKGPIIRVIPHSRDHEVPYKSTGGTGKVCPAKLLLGCFSDQGSPCRRDIDNVPEIGLRLFLLLMVSLGCYV